MENTHEQRKRNMEIAELTIQKLEEAISDLSADMAISQGLVAKLEQIAEKISFLMKRQPETDEEWNTLEKFQTDYDRISSMLEKIMTEAPMQEKQIDELQKEFESLDF